MLRELDQQIAKVTLLLLELILLRRAATSFINSPRFSLYSRHLVLRASVQHLRPTNILQRLYDGVDAAVFGVKNLVEGMRNNK